MVYYPIIITEENNKYSAQFIGVFNLNSRNIIGDADTLNGIKALAKASLRDIYKCYNVEKLVMPEPDVLIEIEGLEENEYITVIPLLQ